jgi:hypothetical protein
LPNYVANVNLIIDNYVYDVNIIINHG